MSGPAWIAAFAMPLVVAAASVIGWRSPRAGADLVRWSQLSLLPALVVALLPQTGESLTVEVPWLLLGTHLQLDVVARSLLLVSILLYGAALWSLTWERTERPGALTAFLLVCFVGNMGVFVAGDAVTFYLSFALMSFAAYALVRHTGTEVARRAGRLYLVMTVLSESAILVGLMLVSGAGGLRVADAPGAVAGSPLVGLIVVLLVAGFGVKAGLFPLHVWLPLAHPAAPPAASAVLSGAMVKAGLVGWLRFLPLGTAELDVLGTLMVVLAIIGAFAAVPVGLMQRDPKAVLAYSTISQMGFLGVLTGVALASPGLAPACITAGIIYAVHHGLAKGALFLGVPVWKHHNRSGARPIVMGGLVIAGLAVVGAPLSSGAVGKYASKSAVEGAALFGVDLVHVLPLVATGSTLLLLRFARRLTTASPDSRDSAEPARDPQLWAWSLLVVTSATLPWVLTDRWVPLQAVPGLDPVTLWAATWPILLALAMALIWQRGLRLPRREAVGTTPRIPAGDLVVVAEKAAGVAQRAVVSAAAAAAATRAGALRTSRRMGEAVARGVDSAAATERGERGSGGGGLVMLIVLVLTAVVLGVNR